MSASSGEGKTARDNVPAAFQSHWFLFAVFKFGRISLFFRTSQDERESKNITWLINSLQVRASYWRHHKEWSLVIILTRGNWKTNTSVSNTDDEHFESSAETWEVCLLAYKYCHHKFDLEKRYLYYGHY